MTTYDLTKKTYGVSGQSKVILGNNNNESGWKRLQNLENITRTMVLNVMKNQCVTIVISSCARLESMVLAHKVCSHNYLIYKL